jgi:hypothetical protein
VSLASQPDLALLLFAPWFLILAVLYWVYPRQPRDGARSGQPQVRGGQRRRHRHPAHG